MRGGNSDLVAYLALFWIFGSILVIPGASASVTVLTVTPEVAKPGDTITISGMASPGEELWLSSSFEISLPVSAGEYSRKFKDIYFPAGKKRFTVTAENVKNIRISLWLFPLLPPLKYPLDGPKNAIDGRATISISLPLTINGDEIDVSGKRDVEVYGDALDGATSVIMDTKSEIQVTANSNGDFSLQIDTGGIPEGEFVISAGGIKKTVYLGVTPTPTPTPTPTSGNGGGGTTPTPTSSTTPTASISPLPSGSPGPTTTPTASISPLPSGSPGPTATPTTIVTPVPTGSPTSAPMAKPGIPGFELILALAGLCVAAHWLWQGRR
jgi:hypothetical protein